MMQQPTFMRAMLDAVATAAATRAVIVNVALIAVFVLLAVWLWLRPGKGAPYLVTALLLLLIWVLAQDAGMFWSGMSTDPNTAPVLALALLAAWTGRPRPWFHGRL